MKYSTVLWIGASLLLASIACTSKKKSQTELSSSQSTQEIKAETASENESLKILPVQHASTVLEFQDQVIYIDPAGGASLFTSCKPPTLVLITDIHGDHMDIKTLDSLNVTNAKLIVPQAVADKLPNMYKNQLVIMNNGDTQKINGVGIEAIPMYNLRPEALKFHEKGRGNGYVLTIGGQRIYFSGDTEDIPEMRSLENIDKAFVCMNLPYTMPVDKAADAVLAFAPKNVFPYHYRGTEGLSDVEEFKNLVTKGNSEIEVIQLDWYPKLQ